MLLCCTNKCYKLTGLSNILHPLFAESSRDVAPKYIVWSSKNYNINKQCNNLLFGITTRSVSRLSVVSLSLFVTLISKSQLHPTLGLDYHRREITINNQITMSGRMVSFRNEDSGRRENTAPLNPRQKHKSRILWIGLGVSAIILLFIIIGILILLMNLKWKMNGPALNYQPTNPPITRPTSSTTAGPTGGVWILLI